MHRPGDASHRLSGDASAMLRTQQQQQQQQQQRDLGSSSYQPKQVGPSNPPSGAKPQRDSSTGSPVVKNQQASRDTAQARISGSREALVQQRERSSGSNVPQVNMTPRDYNRHEYYSQKGHEFPVKQNQEHMSSKASQDFSTKPSPQSPDYPSKTTDYLNKSQDFQAIPQEYPNKQGSQTPSAYKAQSREMPSQGTSTPNNAPNLGPQMRDRVNSPQRVKSPPVKLADSQRLSSPPVKMIDQRPTLEFGKLDGTSSDAPPSPGIMGLTPITSIGGGSTHFVQQYPERDTPSNAQTGGPQAWEGSYLFVPDKYASGVTNSYPPLSITGMPLQHLPSSHLRPANTSEKAVDANEQNELPYTQGNSTNSTKNVNRLSPLGSDSTGEDKFQEYPPEKEDADSEVKVDGFDLKKLSEVTGKMALTVLPDDVDTFNELNKQHLNSHNHLRKLRGMSAHLQGGQFTPESTDCGSLSKSSSDGDHMMNRKRPPTKLKSKRRNILSFPQHLSVDELRVIQRRHDSYCGGSSSDENRSSGHASMSDGHSSSSPPIDSLPRHSHTRANNLKSVPEDERLSVGVTSGLGPPLTNRRGGPPRARHRIIPPFKDDFTLTFESANGLEDIKQAIEQLTIRSQGSRTSYSTSTYSSMSGSEGGEPARRLIRHSSMETINTNITSADEFVWVDSHNRLVELQQLPWSNHDVLRVIQQGRVREQLDRVSMEAVPRLSYLLQRALVRVAREAQRLTRPLAMVSKREVSSAFKIVFSPALADSSIKSCLRAAAMYTVCGDQLRQSKSARAGLNLSVSRFMRWMCDVRIGKFIHEYAAVYLTAGMENLLEEMILQCLPEEEDQLLTATALEHAIANNGDLWGLLQPYAHLNAGRTATGALSLPRWANGTGPMSSDRDSTMSSTEETSTDSGESCCNRSTPSVGGGTTTPGVNASGPGNTGSLGSHGSSSSGISVEGSSSSGNSNPSTTPTNIASCTPKTCSPNSCGNIGHGSTCTGSMLTPEEKIRLNGQSIEQTLLTTCVGSLAELSELVNRVAPHLHKVITLAVPIRSQVTWGPSALHGLFYFMRCSQLEHTDHNSRAPMQELVYERPYIVLPPLVEWVRVATAHTEHRHSAVVDKDDIMQGARLLLPGVDCPVRMIGYEELMCPRRQMNELECAKKFKVDLAFKMLSCGRTDLVPHAIQLLPGTKVNTVNEYGLTPLMLACIRGDEAMVNMLLDVDADVDAETPPTGPAYLMANPETQHWTALTYAAIHGHISIAKILLEKNANVEGGARLAEEKCTETPLQVATAGGHLEMMSLLLSYGANPYLSTLMKDSLCYSGAAQRGCYAAIGVAAAHGQRAALHKLLSQPQHASCREVLSLEEILAEGASSHTSDRERRERNLHSAEEVLSRGGYPAGSIDTSQVVKLTKQQIKTLQEAMYHSAESGHLEMTLDLRNLGVPWTLHCWMHTLATGHEHRLDSIIDQLLQDFLQDWPEDYSTQFVDECLPLLFTIFRYSKNEGTSLLLADIFSSCYGKDVIKEIKDTSISSGARIDPKFVNNPELSDVQFRVEGRVFYAHKIILVNASSRFKQMLSSKVCEGNPPIVQIHDIRYDIFELVMQSLYKGGCENLEVEAVDVLELMAAANFFQLDSLLRYCEARCSMLVHVENVVSMYVHAKVYGAMQLLEYCQGFLLQNMVALLTYDDSVRRLIFGKKLHNHDVLSGLLLTLQARIKARALPRAGKK